MTLEEFFEHFAIVYSRLDVDAVTQLFHVPFFSLVNEERSDFPELAPLYEVTRVLFDWYQSQGFHDASYTIISIVELSSELATAKLRWRVIRSDGSPWEYNTSYHLKQNDGAWKIAGVIQFDEANTAVQSQYQEKRADPFSPLLVVAEEALRDVVHLPHNATSDTSSAT